GPYAALVAAHGLSPAQRLVLEAVPRGARVLDVGCATGYLAAELAARGTAVVGVEADPAAAARGGRPLRARRHRRRRDGGMPGRARRPRAVRRDRVRRRPRAPPRPVGRAGLPRAAAPARG